MTDKEIYQGILNRDNAVFTYMYSEYRNMIFSMIQKNNGSAEDATDILQEGIVALWTNVKLGKFDLRKNVRISTYLYSLCRNLWISQLRKGNKMPVVSDSSGLQIADEPTTGDEAYDRVRMIQDQLKNLGEQCRKLLSWFYYEKRSLREIATELDMTEKSAKNSKYRCMQRLRAAYLKTSNNES